MWKKISLRKFDYHFIYPFLFILLFVLILMQYSFFALEATIFDFWSKMGPTHHSTQDYAVISMDESTDQFLGEIYPYSYATHLKTLKRILQDRPKAIIYFLDLTAPILPQDYIHYGEFVALLKKWSEQHLVRIGTNMDLLGEVLPAEELRPIGHSLSLVNEDSEEFARDGVTRKIILSVSGEESLHLWLFNQLRKSANAPMLQDRDVFGAFYDYQSDAVFTHYFMGFNPLSPPDNVVQLPIQRVAQSQLRTGFFNNKIVLLGHSYRSRPDDFVYSPFSRNQKASKLLVQAAILESLFQHKTLLPLPSWITNALALLLVFVLSVVISRLNPSRGLLFIVGSMMVVLFISYIIFQFLGLWPSMAHLLLSIFLVYYIWVPFRAIAEYQTRFAIEEETKLVKKVDGLKQNFISLMSHDLKTPVAKISGLAEMMVPLVLPTQQELKKHVERIQESIKELNTFISSILDLTKIESQDLKLNIQSKDLNPIVTQVVERLSPLADSKEVTFDLNLGPLYPIKMDVMLIQRVVSNLVENALKYGRQGQVIHIKSWDDDTWVYLSIEDQGQGISVENLDFIFDKFYRVKNDQSHQIKGTGLGLYLVKYFIELHQGKIEVKSTLAVGTCFTIQLKNA